MKLLSGIVTRLDVKDESVLAKKSFCNVCIAVLEAMVPVVAVRVPVEARVPEVARGMVEARVDDMTTRY
tara:strand:+ start:395 stop:601 length:207 start_codon:yes stop_codon:yes gene_type:complete